MLSQATPEVRWHVPSCHLPPKVAPVLLPILRAITRRWQCALLRRRQPTLPCSERQPRSKGHRIAGACFCSRLFRCLSTTTSDLQEPSCKTFQFRAGQVPESTSPSRPSAKCTSRVVSCEKHKIRLRYVLPHSWTAACSGAPGNCALLPISCIL